MSSDIRAGASQINARIVKSYLQFLYKNPFDVKSEASVTKSKLNHSFQMVFVVPVNSYNTYFP